MAGKKFAAAAKKVDSAKKYTVDEAFKMVVDLAPAKFDETVDVGASGLFCSMTTF